MASFAAVIPAPLAKWRAVKLAFPRLRDTPSPLSRAADRKGAAQRALFVIVTTVTVTTLGLGLIALVCFWTVRPIVHDAAFIAATTVRDDLYFYAGQPAKTAAYQTCLFALPFLLALSFWIEWRGALVLRDETVKR